MLTVKAIYDQTAMSGELSVYNGAVLLTCYNLAGGNVSMTALAPVVTSKSDTGNSVNSIIKWINECRAIIGVAPGQISPCLIRVKRTNNGLIKCRYEIGADVQVTEAEYNISTGLISWEARPATVMSFTDFENWVRFLSIMLWEANH